MKSRTDDEKDLLEEPEPQSASGSPKHIRRGRIGVWDFYEEIYAELRGTNTLRQLFQYDEALESFPYLIRMIKDVTSIPGCGRLALLYGLCKIGHSAVPAAGIWFEGQLLTIVQTAIDTRTIDKSLLVRVTIGRIVCSALSTLFFHLQNRLEAPLNSRLRRWYSERSFDAYARLDLPTFSDPTVKRRLEATGDSYWGKTVVWLTLQMVTDILGSAIQLIANAFVLFDVLHKQQDGALLVVLSLINHIYSWLVRMNVFKPARIWLARTVDKDFVTMKGWKSAIENTYNRKEIVANNLGKYASTRYKACAERVGDRDAEWQECQDVLFDTSSSWSLLEEPLGFTPQIAFTLRAVQYPASLPVSLASLHLVESAASTFAFTLYAMLSRAQSIGEQLASVRKLYEVGTVPNQIQDGTIPFPEDSAEIKSGIALEFRNVTFKYPNAEEYALRDVSFSLLPGQLCVIVGSNGSGKSTVLKLVTRLYDPEEGQIFIGGHDIKTLKLHDLREAISVLFQDFAFFPLSIRENIAIGDPSHAHDDERLRAALRLADAERFLDKLPGGVDGYLDRPVDDEYAPIAEGTKLFGDYTVDYAELKKAAGIKKSTGDGTELSGGQMQRLAVARTFMRSVVGEDSKVGLMLFDEPSASLDPIAEHNLFDRLRELRGSKTMVFSSHRFGKLTRHADLILYMDEARIIEAGTHDDLVERKGGEYARLWQLQVEAFVS